MASIVDLGLIGGILITHETAASAQVAQEIIAAASAQKSTAPPAPPAPAKTAIASAAPKPAVPSPAPAPQVLTIGDSIMKGFGLSTAEAWPALIAAKNGWNLTTLACDGAGFLAVGSADDCDDNFLGVVASAASLHPDIIIISGSSNDFGASNAALLKSTITALTRLRTEFPSAQIIGLSTIWGDTDAPGQLAQINAQVKQAVEQVGGTYLDIGQPLSGHPELMQADDVHPTDAGQLSLDAAIQSALTAAQQLAQEAAVQTALASEHGHL